MYDTLHIWLPGERVSNSHLLSRIPDNLSNVTEHQKADGQVFVSGMLKGTCKVNISNQGISLKGSLAKLYLNDNFQTLTRGDAKRAFEMIEDLLHIPIQDAKVSRIDIAHNIMTDQKPEFYYPYLGDCLYYQRLIQPQSLYYNNGQRVMLFYNKIAEGKKQKFQLPEVWQDANVLRYELRYVSRLPKQFNMEEVNVSTLYNEKFYMGMVKRWIQQFESINKLHSINLNFENMNSPKDFIKQLALMKINEIGQDKTLQMVDEMKAWKAFNKPEYYCRLKADIKKLCKSPGLTSSTDLMKELDKKVKAVGKYCR